MNPRYQKVSNLLERFYGSLLLAYPSEFRHEYGAEMAQFFRDDCRRTACRSGLSGLLWQGLRTLADVARSAPGVHMEILRQDLRFAFRMLWNSPAFALTAILALALGIGANSAIFRLVDGIVVMPLPFPEADRLMVVWEKNPKGIDRNSVSPPNFADYRAASKSFSGIAAFYEDSANLIGSGEPEHLLSSMVSPEFFDVVGVSPAIGAGLTAEAGAPKVVLSYGLWQRRFGGDPQIIGRALRIDDKSYAVGGVMPAGFHFGSADVAVWMPMPFDPARFSRQARFLSTVARLRPGVSPAQARAELDAIAAGLAGSYPASNRGWGVTLLPLKEQVVGEIRRSLFVLLGAVGFVLLIACANVANLLLARSARRQGEIAIRTALGASGVRIVRQMLTESVLLALIGGGVGWALSWAALEMLKALAPAAVPRLDEVSVNGWAIAFTFAVALLTGVVSGLAPAWRISRPDLNAGLKEGMANRRSFGGHWLRGALIVSEVALSLLLLLGAGLLIRSFLHLQRLDPGFDPDGALTLTLDMPASRYASDVQRAAFVQHAIERVRALPGVASAGMISTLPLTGGEGFNRFGFTVEGSEDGAAGDHRFYARWISPGYLGSMAIPLIQGRDFTDRDRQGSSPAVIVDAALARRYFPNQNPVGRFLRLSYAKTAPREIIGVAGEVRLVSLDREPAPQIYVPVLQEPRIQTMSLVVRNSADAAATAETIRGELRAIDRDLPIYDVQPLAGRVAQSLAPRRFSMLLMSLLAALAMILAAVGVYGVISYMVGERLHEIGIRVALGARPVEILLLVVKQGMQHALLGIAGGLLVALLLVRVLAGLLYGVSPMDRWTFGAAAVLTAGVALMACLIPAFRAARADPIDALRFRWTPE
jgi:putative ABC transport system permease protein